MFNEIKRLQLSVIMIASFAAGSASAQISSSQGESFKQEHASSAATTDEQELMAAGVRLEQADAYRFPSRATKTVTHVHEYKQGELQKTQIYEVFSKPGKGSLAVFKSAAQAGQKVLMQDGKFWIFLPKTRQPLRISPMQKLLGDASVGDLATLSWTQGYKASLLDEKTIAENNVSLTEVALNLNAVGKGVSYSRIILILDRSDNFPVRAKFFLKSGKLAKIATFTKGELNNQPWVIGMEFENSVVEGEKTVMQVISADYIDIEDKIFNPSFLVRANLENI